MGQNKKANAARRVGNGVNERSELSDASTPPNIVTSGILSSKTILVFHVILTIVCGVLYRNHIFTLKENEVHFSHLSDTEREMSFRTEMGFYYSYYKTLVDQPSFVQGVVDLTIDNGTEYPSTINALKRFNLYPEVFVGALYRFFVTVSDSLGVKTKECWKVNRGEGLPPVESCEGAGDRMYFYIHVVYWLNGAMLSVLFLLAAYLSNSLVGGVVTFAAFFFNQGECSRVQWTPSLRESFAYPICVFHFAVVCHLIKSCHVNRRFPPPDEEADTPPRNASPSPLHAFALIILTVVFILFWQFAQFSLLTQALSVTVCFILGLIRDDVFKLYIRSQIVGLFIALCLLFGNRMLLSSFLTVSLICMELLRITRKFIWKREKNVVYSPVMWLLLGKGFLLYFVVLFHLVTRVIKQEDDAHIAEILKAKFTSFRNFHTLMYTCAREFDFMELEVIWNTSKTLLLPVASLVAFIILCQLLFFLFKCVTFDFAPPSRSDENETEDCNSSAPYSAPIRSKRKPRSTAPTLPSPPLLSTPPPPPTPPVKKTRTIEPPPAEFVFVLIQLAFYTAMAVLIMRLKLFWTPMLCLIMGLLPSRKICPWQEVMTPNIQVGFFGVLLAVSAIMGKINVDRQLSIIGEYNNAPMERMLEFVKSNTAPDSVFAGPMPTMASVKLIADRPIVNHPHYEDSDLRARTMRVYTVASRKPMQEIHRQLASMSVDYVIIDHLWCTGASARQCTMPGVWDVVDPANRGKEAACKKLMESKLAGRPYFEMVFQNEAYTIMQVQPV